MQTRKQYILVETAISVVINVALSIGFVYLIFHGQPQVSTSGRHGIVVDMAPQTFMVTFMGCLIPMLLTGRRLVAGALQWSEPRSRQPRSLWVLALSAAVLLSFLVVTLSWITLPRLIPDGTSFHILVLAKAIFGGLLALAVTPWAIARALR